MRKARQFNRRMMWGMMAMAVILLAVVFGMYYWSMRNQQEKQKAAQATEAQQDTLTVVIEE